MGTHNGTTFAFYVSALRPQKMTKAANAMEVTISVGSGLPVDTATTPYRPPIPVQTESRFSATELTILVVEDNLVNQKVMCRQLRKKGYVVYTACHGLEALEFLEQTKFWSGKEDTGKDLSVILLDIEMPVMDGLTCVRKIRQLEIEGVLNAHIPVVSVSANARHEQVQNAKVAGMVGCSHVFSFIANFRCRMPIFLNLFGS
jgi:CheY-like chemotaxis protein